MTVKHPTWRETILAKPKYITHKFVPVKAERIVDPPGYERNGGPDSNFRIPPRVILAALPYEKELQATIDRYGNILPLRQQLATQKMLARSRRSFYQRLVKRPLCLGVQVSPPPPKVMDFWDWEAHRERILQLSTPKRQDSKVSVIPREWKPLAELMPRILALSAVPKWRVKQMKEVPRDVTKVRSKALLYQITPRVEELARPKKCDDISVEGVLRVQILEKFDKLCENEILRKRAAAKMNFKRV